MKSALKAVQPYLSVKEMELTFPDGSNVYKITIRQGNGALVKEINLLAMFIEVYKTPTAVLFDRVFLSSALRPSPPPGHSQLIGHGYYKTDPVTTAWQTSHYTVRSHPDTHSFVDSVYSRSSNTTS